jgi:hypothetical protein
VHETTKTRPTRALLTDPATVGLALGSTVVSVVVLVVLVIGPWAGWFGEDAVGSPGAIVGGVALASLLARTLALATVLGAMVQTRAATSGAPLGGRELAARVCSRLWSLLTLAAGWLLIARIAVFLQRRVGWFGRLALRAGRGAVALSSLSALIALSDPGRELTVWQAVRAGRARLGRFDVLRSLALAAASAAGVFVLVGVPLSALGSLSPLFVQLGAGLALACGVSGGALVLGGSLARADRGRSAERGSA